MPNTKSAEKRTRSSARKQLANKTAKTRVKSLEKKYLGLVQEGKKDEAAAALRAVTSALDKAAKTGVLNRGTVDRKKSRLAIRLAKAK